MKDAAIWTEDLKKAYRSVRAVDGLTLHVRPGTVYGFLGRNGAGKTTTMRILLGLARAQAGTAHVLGLDAARDREAILDRTAFVGERKDLYGWMTGREFLRFTGGFCRRWSQESAERYSRLLDIPLDRRIRKLSHGTRAKLYLAAALSQQADLLVLDEPTEGLDPQAQEEVRRAIIEDHVSLGRTVFFSSHHLDEVEGTADWVGIIDNGRLRLEAALDDIRSEYRLVIASGRDLPASVSAQVLSVTSENESRRYILRQGADAFVAGLRREGAAVLLEEPLRLRDLFLESVK
jgi:ABC-2 type transport system ATP-binding protein